jgi:hypothetical protein
MSEMVDRIARAIAEAGNGGVWTDEQWYKEYQRDIHRIRARAAIKAMREPTDEMVHAGLLAGCRVNSIEGWRAMVDEALK